MDVQRGHAHRKVRAFLRRLLPSLPVAAHQIGAWPTLSFGQQARDGQPSQLTLDGERGSPKLPRFLMRRFWQIIAFVSLVQIAPASVCCLLPAAFDVEHACCPPSETSLFAPDDVPDAPLPEVPGQRGACPGDALAHSDVPTGLTLPVVPVVELHDVALALLNSLQDAFAQAEGSLPFVPTAPPELRASWLFVSRAALPARWPSDCA